MIKEPPHFGNDKPWMNQLKNWCRTVKDEFERTALRGDGVTTSISSGVVHANILSYPGNFEMVSIDNDNLEMRLDDGVIKIKGLGYAVHTYTYVGNKVDLPAVSSDTTFYVFVEVHSPNILYGFVCSTSLLQDDLSNGIFYVPIYKMKMVEREVDETTEKIYSIILDMRNGVVL